MGLPWHEPPADGDGPTLYERAVALRTVAGHSSSQIAGLLQRLSGLKVTRGAVIGELYRNGIRGGQRGRNSMVVARNKRTTPQLVAVDGEATDLAPEGAGRSKRGQPILIRRDGKLHANDKLTSTSCRWPMGDPLSKQFHFCGCTTVPSKPYCEAHLPRASQPTYVQARQKVLEPA